MESLSTGFSLKSIQYLSIFLFITSLTAYAKPTVYGNATRQFEVHQTDRLFQVEKHDENNIEFCITNYGIFGQGPGWAEPGFLWPKGTDHHYIFGSGPWFGVIDQFTDDTLVTVGYSTYDASFEFTPGLQGMSTNDPYAKIYIYPSVWPPLNEIFPMAPQDAWSFQDSWCAFNDLDPNYHHWGDTRPIGIEVYQTIYLWNLKIIEDIVFLKYEFKNVGNNILTNCYIGFNTDCDVGNEYPNPNDIVAGITGRWYDIDGESLWVDDVCYQYQDVPEPGWSEFPGVIGFDFLQTPWDLVEGADKDSDGIYDQYERDSAYYYQNLPDSLWDVDNDRLPDWRDPSEIPQVGMTAFKRFHQFFVPRRDPWRYLSLAGYNYKTGAYEPWDTTPSPPEDQFCVQGSGPFNLEPDSTVTLIIGIVLAYWHDDYLTPDSALAKVDYSMQLVFDRNWLVPRPPSQPSLTCVPGDAQITLIWDNKAEMEPDPYYQIVSDPGTPLYDPFYKQYDFEGYQLWKNSTGLEGDWYLVARYDLYNGIIFEDTIKPDSIRIKATDTGITHSYIDNDVRNGFDYYYAISAFDYNYVKQDTVDSVGNPIQIPKSVWYETGKEVQISSPRRDPVNFIAGRCSIEVISGNPLLNEDIKIDIVYPLAMTESSIFTEFAPVQYDSASMNAIYTSYLKNGSNLAVDSVYIIAGNNDIDVSHAFAPLHGIMVISNFIKDSIPGDESIFEQIEVQTGSYPESLVTPSLPGPWSSYFAYWPYRGNDYEVRWVSTTGSNTANSVIVTDIMTGDSIYYSPYNPESNHDHDSLANGWCFLSHLDVSDTLILYGSPPATRNTKFLYINGGLVGLKRGGFLQPGDILPQTGDMWYVHANTDFHPAPANALFEIHSTPAYFDTVTKRTLNVKVVPNPFLVHNEWHKILEYPRLRFINLPADCTIRIFTLSGEFIKLIRHHHTNKPEPGETGVLNDAGGDEWWDLRSRTNHNVASGMYIYHIHSAVGEQVGKFVIIR